MCSGRGGAFARTAHKLVAPAIAASAFGHTCLAEEREWRDRNRRSFVDLHHASLQVYLPCFVTDNFITSQRLEAALQHCTLDVMVGLLPGVQARVHERFLDAPRSFGDNSEEDDAIYCEFVTVTHVDV